MGIHFEERLKRARTLLLSSQREDSPPLSLDTYEDVGRCLMEQFRKTAREEFFETFYMLTIPLFTAYCRKIIQEMNTTIEPMDAINRMYALLARKALAPREGEILGYLFPWCFKVVFNMTMEEKRKHHPFTGLPETLPSKRHGQSLLDLLVRREDEAATQRLLEQILDIVKTGAAGLSSRDREIVRLFYLEGLTIRKIAERTGLTESNIGVILMRSREKIAALIMLHKRGISFPPRRRTSCNPPPCAARPGRQECNS